MGNAEKAESELKKRSPNRSDAPANHAMSGGGEIRVSDCLEMGSAALLRSAKTIQRIDALLGSSRRK
jgi:hypothetical protein